MSADSQSIDPGAIGAAEVAYPNAMRGRLNPTVISTDGSVRQGHRVVRGPAERKRLFSEVEGAGRCPVTTDEREPSGLGTPPAKKLGAALLQRKGFGLEAGHRVASPHGELVPDRQDRTSPEAG